MKVSGWIVVEGYCAARIIEGGDINSIKDRVAFIEKTPSVRVKPYTNDKDYLNWEQGSKGCGGCDGSNPNNELYGFYPPSREWCDEKLIELGYSL